METERFKKFTLLVEGSHKAVQKIKYTRAHDFGVKGVHTLWVYELLQHPDGISASELASKNMIDRSLISRELRTLYNQGYIEFEKNSGRRNYNKKLSLTEKGREIAGEIGSVAIDIQEKVGEGISEEDLETFYKVFDRLNKNLQSVAYDGAEQKNESN